MTNAEKTYELFKTITSSKELSSMTSKQNVLFTVLKRAERDEDYKKEMSDFIIPDGSGMNILEAITTFFNNFSNLHGLDITLGLTELSDINYPEGLYLDVKTFKMVNGQLVECSPVEYKTSEMAYFKVCVLNAETDEEVEVPFITYTVECEDGNKLSGEKSNSSFIEFSATCNRPGAVKAIIDACDENKEHIKCASKSICGALFDFREIRTSAETPADFEEFWKGEAERLLKISPVDTKFEEYSGNTDFVKNAFETNYYHIKKINKFDLEFLRQKRISRESDEILDEYDLYEYALKSPGPCPATGYVSFPKNAQPGSLTMQFCYDGYSAHSPQPIFRKDKIFVHATHHGYPCNLSDEEFYNNLNGRGILGYYGRGTYGKNSVFTDIHDCYMLYITLRNAQAIRYFTNAEFSADIPEIARLWNGELYIEGGSLGGYQAIASSAILPFLDVKYKSAHCDSEVPGLADYAGQKSGRVQNIFGIRWSENCEYFDTAHLATLIRIPTVITRSSMGDEICIPSALSTIFNNLKVEKEIRFHQNSSHGYLPKNRDKLWFIHKG